MSKIFYYAEIILIGIIFHLIFGYIMFDTVYKFPLNYGMTPHSPPYKENEIPSKRVAIVIIDGARADVFFDIISSGKAPFLKEIVTKRGVYGISHTQSPTETFPTTKALFSGHFFDSSMNLKLLYNIPITLDLVFNETKHSYLIGRDHCDFAEVAQNTECVDYPPEYDVWELNDYEMFDTNARLFEMAKTNKNLENNLNQNKISFLLHLNYSDYMAHCIGPKADRLKKHFIKLDSYFEKLERDFYNYYKDNKTTFIIVSDHGMNDNKRHEMTNPNVTRSPLIVWGSGIKHAKYIDENKIYKKDSEEINLDYIFKYEISQIDVAALISGLLGINYPLNSNGVVPLDLLNVSDIVKSKMLFGNMMELFENYKIKNDKKSKSLIYRQYSPLKYSKERIDDIIYHINNSESTLALNKIQDLIKAIKKGIDYTYNYDSYYLKRMVITSYILWIFFIFIFVEMKERNKLKKFFFSLDKNRLNIISAIITLFFVVYLFLRLSPFRYYIYTLFPCYFFWRILVNHKYLKSFFEMNYNLITGIKNILFYLIGIFAFLPLVRNNFI